MSQDCVASRTRLNAIVTLILLLFVPKTDKYILQQFRRNLRLQEENQNLKERYHNLKEKYQKFEHFGEELATVNEMWFRLVGTDPTPSKNEDSKVAPLIWSWTDGERDGDAVPDIALIQEHSEDKNSKRNTPTQQ